MRKHLIVHVFFLMISALVYHLGILSNGPNLIWNMFLALLAYDIAVFSYYTQERTVLILTLLVWLAFYPNTFYMLTDLVHMSWISRTLWEQEIMLLFMAYTLSILFGIFCGIESWNLIRNRLALPWWSDYLIIPILSFISSFAISIGRYERFNSWDLVTAPHTVVRALIATYSWNRVYFVLGFTLVQVLSLFFLGQGKITENKKAKHSS